MGGAFVSAGERALGREGGLAQRERARERACRGCVAAQQSGKRSRPARVNASCLLPQQSRPDAGRRASAHLSSNVRPRNMSLYSLSASALSSCGRGKAKRQHGPPHRSLCLCSSETRRLRVRVRGGRGGRCGCGGGAGEGAARGAASAGRGRGVCAAQGGRHRRGCASRRCGWRSARKAGAAAAAAAARRGEARARRRRKRSLTAGRCVLMQPRSSQPRWNGAVRLRRRLRREPLVLCVGWRTADEARVVAAAGHRSAALRSHSRRRCRGTSPRPRPMPEAVACRIA